MLIAARYTSSHGPNRFGCGGYAGFVRHDGDGVWIEVEGPEVLVSAFPAHVRNAAARLVQLEEIERTELAPHSERTFEVR